MVPHWVNDPSRVVINLYRTCFSMTLTIMIATANWFSQKSATLTPAQQWVMLWRDCPLLVWSVFALLYQLVRMNVRRFRPDSRFLHVKTDIVCVSILVGTGLAFVVSNTIYGIGPSWYRQLAAILGYLDVFLVSAGLVTLIPQLMGILLYEAIYVRIHFGPRWTVSLQYLSMHPELRIRSVGESQEPQEECQTEGVHPTPPDPHPDDVLPSYEMIGSNNAAAFFGAEGVPARRVSESDAGARGIQDSEMRMKRDVLALGEGGWNGRGSRGRPPSPPTAYERRMKLDVLDTLERGGGMKEGCENEKDGSAEGRSEGRS